MMHKADKALDGFMSSYTAVCSDKTHTDTVCKEQLSAGCVATP